AIITELEEYRTWADPLLKEHHARAGHDGPQKLRTALALLPVDPGQKEYLYQRLLRAEPNEVAVLRDALAPHHAELRARLWAVVEHPPAGQQQQRLRAACALAAYDLASPRWGNAQTQVVGDLVAVNAVFLGVWLEGFRPVKNHLLGPLAAMFRER